MPAKAVITAPVPTVQGTAREMGVAKARVRQLRQIMTAIVEGRDGRAARFLTRTAPAGPKRRAVAKRRVARRKQTARSSTSPTTPTTKSSSSRSLPG